MTDSFKALTKQSVASVINFKTLVFVLFDKEKKDNLRIMGYFAKFR